MSREAKTTDDKIAAMEQRIVELEEQLSRLAGHCHELEWKITRLSVSKIADPKYALWDWVLRRGLTDEGYRRLMHLLSVLDARAAGEVLPEMLKKDVDEVPSATLYASAPLRADEAIELIKRALRLARDEDAFELLEAARAQRLYQNLTSLVVRPA